MQRPGFAARRGAEQRRAPHKHHPGAQRQRLDDIGAAPDAAVQHDRELLADGVRDLRQHLDRGLRAVELAAAVVRHEDAVRAVLGREPRVFHRHDALDQELLRPQLAQPGEVLPVQLRAPRAEFGQGWRRDAAAIVDIQVLEARHARRQQRAQEDAGEPARVQRPVHHVGEVERERHFEIVAAVVLAVAADDHIGGNHQRLETGVERTGNEATRQVVVLGHVELEPLGAAGVPGNPLHRHERSRGQHVRHAGGRRGPAERDVGVVAVEPRGSSRRDAEWRLESPAPQRHFLRALRHVHQRARHEADALEVGAVGAQRDLVLCAARQEFVCNARQPPLRDGLQVTDVVCLKIVHGPDFTARRAHAKQA